MRLAQRNIILTGFISILFCLPGEAALAQTSSTVAQLKPFAGRLAYSADGNYHDEDDIAANPFVLMLLARSNYQSKLVHFEYGNHIWYTRPSQLARLELATKTAATRFGFDTSIFYNCIVDRFAAYKHLKDEILASDEANPLTILGAGPMHTIYQALKLANAVDPTKLKYVTLVSHSPAKGDSSSNNEHGLYDNRKGKDPIHTHNSPEPAKVWDDIARDFPLLKLVIIRGQNGPYDERKLDGYDFCVAYSNIKDWMSSFPDSNVQWVWENMKAVFRNKADVSDAGMAWYWLTGGDQYGNLEKVKAALSNSFVADENFNDEQPGAKPAKWTTTKGITIQLLPGTSFDDRGMRIRDRSRRKQTHAIRKFSTQHADVLVDIDMMFVNEKPGDVDMKLQSAGGEDVLVIRISGNAVKIKKRSGDWEEIGELNNGRLNHITLEVSAKAGTCTVVLNGRIVKPQADTGRTVKDGLSQLVLSTGRKYKGVAWFDNLKVYHP